jgi:hypothetical protein
MVFNLILFLLFGILHQGGVVPSLLAFGKGPVDSSTTIHKVIFFHSYMPPTFLTRSSSLSSVAVSDEEDSCLGGLPETEEENDQDQVCGAYILEGTAASACHNSAASSVVDLKGSDLNRLRQVLHEELSCHPPPDDEFHRNDDEMAFITTSTRTTDTPVTTTKIQLVMPPLSQSTAGVKAEDSSFYFSTKSCIVLGYRCHVVRNHRPHLTTEDFLGGTSLSELWENMALTVYEISNSC